MVLHFIKNRHVYSTWFYLIQTHSQTGRSKVLTTVCNRRSIEEIKISLQNTMPEYIYSIDTAPVYEPNRRCDICNCPK